MSYTELGTGNFNTNYTEPNTAFDSEWEEIDRYRFANESVVNGTPLPALASLSLSSIYNNTLGFYSNPFGNQVSIDDPNDFQDIYENHSNFLYSENTEDQNRAISTIDRQDDYNNNILDVSAIFTGGVGLIKSLRGLRMARTVTSSAKKGGITGTRKVPKSQVAPLSKGVNPSKGRANCVGCAEAMYKRLEGNTSAVSKFTDDDLGDLITHPIKKDEVIQFFEKTHPTEVSNYLIKQGFDKVAGSHGANFPMFKNVREFVEKQPIGSHYLVTTGTLKKGHALNIINTKKGAALIDPQNEMLLYMKDASQYVRDVFHSNTNLWTK